MLKIHIERHIFINGGKPQSILTLLGFDFVFMISHQLIFLSRQQILVHNSDLFKSHSFFLKLNEVLRDTLSYFHQLQFSLVTVPHVLIVLVKHEKVVNYAPFNLLCYK